MDENVASDDLKLVDECLYTSRSGHPRSRLFFRSSAQIQGTLDLLTVLTCQEDLFRSTQDLTFIKLSDFKHFQALSDKQVVGGVPRNQGSGEGSGVEVLTPPCTPL